ncbi:MAG: class I SAM-dependent methyltransferase [Bacteroidales bacterium]|nr:class I SAM-dependent methyltransferase [Bacteroidales bacterium]
MKNRNKQKKPSIEKLDVFYVLEQKKELIQRVAAENFFSGNFLDIGCGRMPYKNIIEPYVEKYTGVDIENEIYQNELKPDVFWNGSVLPFENSTIDSAMLVEVLEHIPETKKVLDEISRVLKENAALLITVPFLWNLHDIPNDEYRFTPYSLKRFLNNSGFSIIDMQAFGNWHASMATMLGLYVRRAVKSSWKKYALSVLLRPLIIKLFEKDKKANHRNFNNGMMINGIWCLAKKSNNGYNQQKQNV